MPQFLSLNFDYLFYQIYSFFYTPFRATVAVPGQPAVVPPPLYSTAAILFFIIIALLLLWLIAHLLIKIRHLNIDHEWRLYNAAQEGKKAAANEENSQWVSIKSFYSSENSSDWKVAIIEADKMLDEAIQSTGAIGENLGERLKSFDSKSATWLDDAWEAHKVRNRIAHETDFVLDRRQAQIAIGKYERALHELRVI